MTEGRSNEYIVARKLLIAFATYGFQKTSMQHLAAAAGLSRQSVYKKFGSKEKCYEWVLNTYLADMYTRIFQELDDDQSAPEQVLIKVFDIFIGDAVEIIKNESGTEVLDDALKMTHSSEEDWPLRFRSRLAGFLSRKKLTSHNNAPGIAYTLISAGKGLLVEESSRDSFTKNMTLIICSVINGGKSTSHTENNHD